MQCLKFLLAVVVLPLLLCYCQTEDFNGTCTISCRGQEMFFPFPQYAVGPPGKAGPKGGRGSIGLKGGKGSPGSPGNACSCYGYSELKAEIDRLKREVLKLSPKPTVQDIKRLGYSERAPGLWYKLHLTRLNYEQARQTCMVDGGKLAAKGLRNSRIRRQTMSIVNVRCWVGLDDLQIRDRWVWSDGIVSTRYNTNWYPDEPNSGQERCAQAYTSKYSWKLNDDDCTKKYAALCEIEM